MVGQDRNRGIEVTLRNALEPWHVMGEEGSSGGTVRYVDSSLERIEVRVTATTTAAMWSPSTGQALPLQPTGTWVEFVAGVRYKAWNPPSACTPPSARTAPLTFDIVDTWMNKSLGGCQYHVVHPGGPQLRHLPHQRLRGRKPPPGALLPHGAHPGKMEAVPPGRCRQPGVSVHAGSAATMGPAGLGYPDAAPQFTACGGNCGFGERIVG